MSNLHCQILPRTHRKDGHQRSDSNDADVVNSFQKVTQNVAVWESNSPPTEPLCFSRSSQTSPSARASSSVSGRRSRTDSWSATWIHGRRVTRPRRSEFFSPEGFWRARTSRCARWTSDGSGCPWSSWAGSPRGSRGPQRCALSRENSLLSGLVTRLLVCKSAGHPDLVNIIINECIINKTQHVYVCVCIQIWMHTFVYNYTSINILYICTCVAKKVYKYYKSILALCRTVNDVYFYTTWLFNSKTTDKVKLKCHWLSQSQSMWNSFIHHRVIQAAESKPESRVPSREATGTIF